MDRHGWASQSRIESARDHQERIVDRFGLQAPHRHPMPPLVGWIQFRRSGVGGLAGHAIGLGEEQSADELLGGPTIDMDELPSQMVEQFGVGGSFS